MILHQKMFQQLVDKIIADIGYNINIIDTEGYIVASGSTKRIGTFHAVGAQAAKTEQRIDIDEKSENQYDGVKAGINQPFYYNGSLAGVIGITGNTAEISEFVRVVKTMIELMVEQELLKEKMYYRQSNKSYFANLLLNIKSDEDKITLVRWAKKLGYNLQEPRAMILVSFDSKYEESVYTDILQQLKKVEGHKKEDFSAMIGSDQLMILKTVGEERANDFQLSHSEELKAYGDGILSALKAIDVHKVYVGIGSVYDQVEDQHKGYNEAMFTINQMKNNMPSRRVASIYDHLFDYASSYVPQSYFDHFVKKYYTVLSQQGELLDTVIALTLNHMNLVDTAKSLFVHRNTVVFRVNKLKELTGLWPTHNHKDRVMCQLITVYHQSLNRG